MRVFIIPRKGRMSETLTAFLSFFIFIPLYITSFIQPGWMDARDGLLLYFFSLFLSLFSKRWIKFKPKSVGGTDNLSFSLISLFSPRLPRETRDLVAGD